VIALSLAVSPNMKGKRRNAEIAADEYPPIDQACVILSSAKNNQLAQQFLSYVKGAAAADVLATDGFDVTHRGNRRRFFAMHLYVVVDCKTHNCKTAHATTVEYWMSYPDDREPDLWAPIRRRAFAKGKFPQHRGDKLKAQAPAFRSAPSILAKKHTLFHALRARCGSTRAALA
jgi:Bacterial extracellular solute-binding protein